jgi:cytochrome c551/c552
MKRRTGESRNRKWRGPGGARAFSTLLLLAPLSIGWAQRPSGPTENAMAGSWVFGAKGCANCHSINGVGKTVGPDLGRGQLHTYYDLAAAFWNHYPGMAARMRAQSIEPPRMSPGEMGDLIAFLTSVNYFDPPGDADKGKTVFTQKRCIRCHQVGGTGGVIGPSLDYLGQTGSPIQVAAAMWNHGPAMSEAMRTQGIDRPTFTAAELTDLLAYLQAASPGPVDRPVYLLPGRADLGRRWVVEKGCPKCHSFRGQGGVLAPDLARRVRPLSLYQFAAMLWNKAPAMRLVMQAQGIEAPQLEASQMADIVAYLYSVQYFQPQGNAAAGPPLLQSRGCLRCHSLHGRGGRQAGDLAAIKKFSSLAGVIAAMWNHGRLVAKAAPDRTTWSKLTPEEMADITAYFLNAGSAR